MKIDRKCIECGNEKTKRDKVRDIYLCEQCAGSDKYKLLCKKTVKDMFSLTDNDIDNLEYYDYQGYRCSMKLYEVSDVKNVFCAKYYVNRANNDEIIRIAQEIKEEKIRSKTERSERIELKRKENMIKRKADLVKALSDYKLEFRNDSNLCSGYVDGSIKGWTVSRIVHRMCQMKYLYDYCDMDKYYEKAYKNHKEEIKAGYYPDTSVSDDAEGMALKKAGGYPDVWPWMV